jgi:V/A-type H+-transporting ATPase subunit E
MSEHNLKGLIAKVKAEAIEKADKEAQELISQAQQQAAKIVKKAEQERKEILEKANATSEEIQSKGVIALKQAARDVNLSIKSDLIELFKSVLEANIEEAFSKEVYVAVIKEFTKALKGNLSISLPEELEDQLVNSIRQEVAQNSSAATVIKDKNLLSGLSVRQTDEGWSYDMTAEEISELLNSNLSQRWMTILNSD